MTLIGVVVAVLFERVLGQWPGWGRAVVLPWLLREAPRRLPFPRFWQHPAVLLLWWGVPVLLVYRGLSVIADPILVALLSAGLLLLCLGPRDLSSDIRRLQEAREAGDTRTEQECVQGLRYELPPGEATQRSLLGALFVQSHERLFGVLLAFLVFGAAGAVGYRIASGLPRFLLTEQGESPAQRAARAFHAFLAWVPARVTALLFGLAGSLDHALAAWRRVQSSDLAAQPRTWTLLAEVAAAAVVREEADGATSVPGRLEECLDEVLRMQWRALLILLATFGVATTGALL